MVHHANKFVNVSACVNNALFQNRLSYVKNLMYEFTEQCVRPILTYAKAALTKPDPGETKQMLDKGEKQTLRTVVRMSRGDLIRM